MQFRKFMRSAIHFTSWPLAESEEKITKKTHCNFLELIALFSVFWVAYCVAQSVSISPILFCILYFVLYFRTEWRSELDRPRKWRIRVTQIPCDCKDNEDPGMELAPAGNLWILWAVLYLVYSTGCTIWRGVHLISQIIFFHFYAGKI